MYLFVEDDEQLDKALEVRARLPQLRKIIVFDMEGLRDFNDPQVMSLEALRALGREHQAAHPGLWEAAPRRAQARGPRDPHLHLRNDRQAEGRDALACQHRVRVQPVRRIFAQRPDDERICFLPLCHVAERVVGSYTALLTGTLLNFVENPETVPENVREIAPTVFGAVPRIWEKFYSGVLIRLKEASRLQQWAYGVAIGIGHRVAKRREQREAGAGAACRGVLARARAGPQQHAQGDRRAPRAAADHRRGADLARSVALVHGARAWRWSRSGDRPSRGGISTANPAGGAKPGSIGLPLPHDRGQAVAAKASCWCAAHRCSWAISTSRRRPPRRCATAGCTPATSAASTTEGYFYITDRMKDIIITAGGKNITPSEFENQLKFSPYVTDAVVIGDRRPFLTALVMIDHENVEQYAQDHSIPFSNYASLCRRPEIQELIQGEIDQGQRGLRARRAGPQVPPDRAEAHRRGRGADPDHEAEAQAGEREVPRPDRVDVRARSGLIV